MKMGTEVRRMQLHEETVEASTKDAGTQISRAIQRASEPMRSAQCLSDPNVSQQAVLGARIHDSRRRPSTECSQVERSRPVVTLQVSLVGRQVVVLPRLGLLDLAFAMTSAGTAQRHLYVKRTLARA